MTRKCAVVIGVDNVGSLQPLQGAAKGALDFSKWAKASGYDVTTLTDKQQPVTNNLIFTAIDSYVQLGNCSQLIVYFSGHGILRGPDYELWLLSGAPGNPNEAVNVTGSIFASRNCGIPHIVFISDACRSMPDNFGYSQMLGGVIFPTLVPKHPRPEVDVFYATIPGDPAYEVKLDKAIKRDGVFTKCLLQGLSGVDKKYISAIKSQSVHNSKVIEEVKKWVIKPIDLKNYLIEIVPKTIAKIDINLQQDPDIRVESHDPKYLVEIPDFKPDTSPNIDFKLPDNQGWKGINQFPRNYTFSRRVTDLSDFIFDSSIKERFGFEKSSNPMIIDIVDKLYVDGSKKIKIDQSFNRNFVSNFRNIVEAKGRRSFETKTGFTIVGSRVINAYFFQAHGELFDEDKNQHIRIDNLRSKRATALLELENGYSVPIAIIPEFIGTIVIKNGNVLTVNYTPSENSHLFYEYQQREKDVQERRQLAALAAESARNGFHFKNAKHLADYLRRFKAFDPALGLYATYAYAQEGKLEAILSIYEYMIKDEQWIFDICLLAGKLEDLTSKATPFCPLLSQGWAYLNAHAELLNPVVSEASKNMVPALWTTFDRKGTEILVDSIKRNKI